MSALDGYCPIIPILLKFIIVEIKIILCLTNIMLIKCFDFNALIEVFYAK